MEPVSKEEIKDEESSIMKLISSEDGKKLQHPVAPKQTSQQKSSQRENPKKRSWADDFDSDSD